MNKIPLLIAFFIILLIVFFKIDSLANERAPGKLSLTLRTNRIIMMSSQSGSRYLFVRIKHDQPNRFEQC